MKHFIATILIFLTFTSWSQVADPPPTTATEDSTKSANVNPDSLVAVTGSDAILTDCVIGDSCKPDVIVFENSGNSVVSSSNNQENTLEDYMDADEINPYKLNATTVPKGAVINLIDSNIPNYFTPCYCSVNSPFGYRLWGRYYQFHPGLDLNLPFGQPARAAFAGTVRLAKMTPGYGNCVIIRHPNGLETLYGHFSELAVTPGQEVKAGDVVGYIWVCLSIRHRWFSRSSTP
jgi:hypothetical protein